MKKKVLIIIGTFLLLFQIPTLTACMTSVSGFTERSGYFTYKLELKTEELLSIGLSKEGQQQETIVLPYMLEGRTISRIGKTVKYSFNDSHNWKGYFKSEKLKNLYFPKGFSRNKLDDGFFDGIPNLKNIYWADIDAKLDETEIDKTTYVSYANYQKNSIQAGNGGTIDFSSYKVANVSYYMNDGTDHIHFIDYVDGSNITTIPSIPYWKEYTFTGWYKDKEATIPWDFDNDIVDPIKKDSNGNDIIEEVKLYAGWSYIEVKKPPHRV